MQNAQCSMFNAKLKRLAPRVAVVALLVTAAPAISAPPASPFVRLYDTAKPSPQPLAPGVVAKRTGWRLVPEGDRTHRFTGDAVFANDKLAVVLRRGGAGAAVYSVAAGKWKRRSLLAPCAAAGDPAAGLAALTITENTPAAVTLTATFRTAGGTSASAAFRMTTGMPIAEFRAGKGTQRVRVVDDIRYLVVPELFTDDVVLPPESLTHTWRAIPTENILLALLEGHDALATIVWRSVEQNADALRHAARKDIFGGCEIDCPEGERVWYGLLEAEAIWYEHPLTPADISQTLRLPWRPPFPARWRAALSHAEGRRAAFDVLNGEPPKGHFVPGIGKTFSAPLDTAWWERDALCLRLRQFVLPNRVMLYAIDRSAATPLAVYCPVDVMRNALGVGVCQYVLDAEGMGDAADATPAQVADWLERTFRRKNAGGQGEAVQQRFDALIKHVRDMEKRAGEYLELARRLADRCKQAESEPSLAATAKEFGAILLDMAMSASRYATNDADPRAKIKLRNVLVKACEVLREEIVEQIGEPKAAEAVGGWTRALRDFGGDLDGTLGESRLTLRRVRARCRMLAATRPETAKFVRAIQQEVDNALRPKRPAAPAAEGEKR